MIIDIFDLQDAPILTTKFWVNWPLGSEEEAHTDIQDGHQGGQLEFPIQIILATFDLQVVRILTTPVASFKSNGLSVLEKKHKIYFQDGRHGSHLGFLIKWY